MKPIILRGITWNHSRALPPLVATAQRFEELHPGVQIEWKKRTLHEFGHQDLISLARDFDLLVIDHPMAGDAEKHKVILDLLPILSASELNDVRGDSIGPSFASYIYHDALWALPIDAAAPAASLRPDLFEKHGLKEPENWRDVLTLAKLGWARMPAFSADLFLNFMGLCVSRGATIAGDPERLVSSTTGAECLEMLRELASLMPPGIYNTNPIALYEQMAAGNEIAYCPFAYTYSNYSRKGFGNHHVRFCNPVALNDGTPIRTVLGGTGIAISSSCKERSLAVDYSLFVAGRTCQQTLYGVTGGQPARRSAWENKALNALTDNFFSRTSESIEAAYVRPRYLGYVSLQESGGNLIAGFCKGKQKAQQTMNELDALYRETLKGHAFHD
jgi:multiple sugar transport system substrate-binding protein